MKTRGIYKLHLFLSRFQIMKGFNVSEIQYISRDYSQLFSKPLVYLHYMTKSDKYPNAAYQYVLKKEPFDDETTNA